MSNTPVDMPKVCQMFDAGWVVRMRKDCMGSYTAQALTENLELWHKAKTKITELLKTKWPSDQAVDLANSDFDVEGVVDTADFTPEQALTRLAYKVHGEILGAPKPESEPHDG